LLCGVVPDEQYNRQQRGTIPVSRIYRAAGIIEQVWRLSPEDMHYIAYLDRRTGVFSEDAFTGVPSDEALQEIVRLQPQHTDLFWAPAGFTGGRKNIHQANTNLLWADLDGFTPYTLSERLRQVGWATPNISWHTSPGNMQALWFIEPLESVERWADYNQWLTYRLGADRGGWHGSKLLRVPGSRNWKRDGSYGRIDTWEIRPTPLSLSFELPQREESKRGDIPVVVVPSREVWERALAEVDDAVYSLVVSRDKDRSQAIWTRTRMLKGLGYSVGDIFTFLYFSPVNKWHNQPVRLMEDIQKAFNTP
jgi:hypothetical protein